jgi:hypothetical protein
MNNPDWLAEARKAANHIAEHMFTAHRGAMPWRLLGVTVVFGNDGYGQDERARREVQIVRRVLAETGVAELGFATCDEDDYTWAMLIKAEDHAAWDAMLWAAWSHLNGTDEEDDEIQRRIAADAIDQSGVKPTESLN